ncbi:enoyl-CoA hydratase-related protein [Arthrobacter sp. I2-34]|uniref:Enoyl-CoA hydratase-related protein n=1 Tax=Arthrobacter hankyongi TaxID=2904801 RepID=A0ABS9L3P7_9MICC|nr:enoyl-CoA hydratase-related protein [Arthrobacter hankyongi]MCG2621300.1 enoyl-CoA hydratase-related protein [Arthrobacter hankyongi]
MTTTNYQTIEFTNDGRIAYLKLNRPERLNALSDQLESEIRTALMEFDLDDRLWVLIIHGEGKAFCAGLDVKEHSSFSFGSDDQTRSEKALAALRAGHLGGAQHLRGTGGEGWLGRTANYKPVIAAVHGYALGGGAHLAAECDLIVAAEDARFAIAETMTGMSGSRTWAKIKTFMPSKVASEMLITGRRMEAAELYRLGLVNRLVPEGQHLKAAEELAREVLQAPPLATRDAVRVTRKQWVPLATELDEQMQLSRLDLTNDFREANRAFAEKRTPNFQAN